MKKKLLLALIIGLPVTLMILALFIIGRNSEIAVEKRSVVAACEQHRKATYIHEQGFKDTAAYTAVLLSEHRDSAIVHFILFKIQSEKEQRLNAVNTCTKHNNEWTVVEAGIPMAAGQN